MFVAWILFVGITTVISRHFKTGFGNSKMFGIKVWFQVGTPKEPIHYTEVQKLQRKLDLFLSDHIFM